MKITFIQPFYKNTWESMSVGHIASYCKKMCNEKLEYNFFHGNFDSDEDIINGSINSDIVAFTCTSPTFKHGVSLATSIKKKNKKARIVFGGHHVSALAPLNAINNDCIDQMVIGEGEQGFLDILNGNSDRIILGSKINFNTSPWPDRDLIQNGRTVELCEKMTGVRIASFQANRGCPFRCSFCSERNITGIINRNNPMRNRDVNDVLDEILHVSQELKLNKFKFVDATFDWNAKYVIEFCKQKIERQIPIEWECMIHANTATEEMFEWLKKSQCNQVNIGCESGSPKILKAIRKAVSVEKIEKVFQWAKNNNIHRRAFFLVGVPEETKEDIKLTEELIERISPDYFGVTLLCPYPGSDYYDHQKYKDIDWSNTDEYSNDFWRTPNFTNEELKYWQRYLVDKNKDRLCERQKDLQT